MTTETAILAGGCFWGAQELLRQRPGVISTRVGYSGGDTPNATYRNHGDHAEAVEIVFDPDVISLPGPAGVLLPDPRPVDEGPAGQRPRPQLPLGDLLRGRRAAAGRAGHDRGRRRVRPLAGQGRHRGEPAGPFWEAEEEHQDYLEKYPYGYTCHFVRPGWKLPHRETQASR